MTARYSIPAGLHRVEEEIDRSRFITTVGYAPTVEAARLLIEQVSNEFADATHNCWAYVVGHPGSTAQVGLSDDGEPHGTAGRPMLTVLLHSQVGDICAVVTRYFGGILLGKGGLVRAYSGGIQLALQTLPLIERVPKVDLLVLVDYPSITPLKRILLEYEIEVLSEEYAADITLQLRLPEARSAVFVEALMQLTNGQAIVDRVTG